MLAQISDDNQEEEKMPSHHMDNSFDYAVARVACTDPPNKL
jgi:hypothetical protein